MKRLLFIFGFIASVTFAGSMSAQAQTMVTTSSFNAQVTLLDAQISSGDTASAKATFANINTMMINVLGVSKASIRDAGTDSTRSYYVNYLTTQQIPLYHNIWTLKQDMVTNHSTLITKLNAFSALIY